MYSGIMRKDDNRTLKSLSGRSVTYKLSGFIIKTGETNEDQQMDEAGMVFCRGGGSGMLRADGG